MTGHAEAVDLGQPAPPTLSPEPLAQFAQRLSDSFAQGTFVRLILSGSDKGSGRDSPRAEAGQKGRGAPAKVLGRCIDLRGKPHLSRSFRYATRDDVKNLPLAKAVEWVTGRLGSQFRNALLGTTDRDWQLSIPLGKRPRLVGHPPAMPVAPSRDHNQSRNTMLDGSARDWLSGLGVTDRSGQVRPGMASKHSQISRYLEIFSHLGKELGWLTPPANGNTGRVITIADMGCGKGYLTFGLWHLCCRVWRLPVRIVGVETRGDLVASTNQLARAIGAEPLEFIRGDVQSVQLSAVDGLVALHACNTATDDAILRGVQLGARLVLLAPCCHKELRPQLGHPPPLAPVLRHGIMEERMAEWLTDGLRALYREWAGYRTKNFEIIDSQHTPKNLMIAAFREGPAFADAAARARIEELKRFFGIQHHALDSLLPAPAAGS